MIDAGVSGDTSIVEATVSGDIGYIVGMFVTSAGDQVLSAGKYIETWHRGDDGQWRISNDIFNYNMPAMAGGGGNAHMMISHEVENAEHWLAAWSGEDSRHKIFKDNGAAHVHVMQNADNPDQTGLVISVSDMSALQTMLTSDEGVAAATEDGVKLDTMVIMTDAE